MGLYFELAQGSSMRLCLDLEKTFPDLRGWELKLMRHLYEVAYISEIYDAVCEDTWLRTTITLEDNTNPHTRTGVVPTFDLPIFSEKSHECNVVARIIAHNSSPAGQMYWSSLQELHRELTKRIKIQSNILPRKAYQEKLFEELRRHESFWTRLQSLLRGSYNSCIPACYTREFYPASEVLAEEVEEGQSMMQKKKEWRIKDGKCVLARLLHPESNVPCAEHQRMREKLREVKRTEVESDKKLGVGSEGIVFRVSWRNGKYARKAFEHESLEIFEKECKVSLKGLHPHVVHPFARTSDVDGNDCLLMELLSGDLYKFAIKKDLARDKGEPQPSETGVNQEDSVPSKPPIADDEEELQPPQPPGSVSSDPPFSRADRLDVLLQIASALKFLHDKDVVHGDLKPQNILISHFEISEDLRHFLVKITDFGNAQFILSGQGFKPGGPGTNQYAAPEVLMSRKTWQEEDEVIADLTKIDIYSFGVIAYEILTGQEVYNGVYVGKEEQQRVIDGTLQPSSSVEWQKMKRIYPIELVRHLESCWELDPSKRPSISDLYEVLLRSKSKMQLLERRAANMRIFLALCLIAFICAFVTGHTV